MTFFKSSFTLRTSTLLPTILDDIEVFKMGFACFCCCPFCPPIFPQGSGFGEVCLAMAGSILCLSDYHAANPARQLAMMSLTRPWHPLMDGASHFKHIHTEKSTLLRLQLKGLILKSASQPCCCQANSEEKRNIAQCSKTTRMYGPSSPKQVASSHVFSHSFRLCTKNIFKHDNACKLQNKKSTSKRPGKPNRNAIKYLWRLSQNLCARPQCCAAW